MKQVNLKTFEVGAQLSKSRSNLYGNYFYMFPADDKLYQVWFGGVSFGFHSCGNYGMATCQDIGNVYHNWTSSNDSATRSFQGLRVQVRAYASEDSYARYQRHALCFLVNGTTYYELYCGICNYDLGGCSTGGFKLMANLTSTAHDFNVGFAYSTLYVVYDDGSNNLKVKFLDSTDSAARDNYEYDESETFNLVSYAKVSNIQTSRSIYVGAAYSLAYRISLTSSGTTKVLPTSPVEAAGTVQNYDPDYYPKILHEFGPPTNLSVSYIVAIQTNSMIGISFNADPWTHAQNPSSASITGSTNKINTYSSTNYISMNDFVSYTGLAGYVRSTTGVVTSSGVCGPTFFYITIAGTFKQCLTACPSYLPKHEVEANLERKCVETCSGPYTDVQDTNACLLVSCTSYPSSTYKFWNSNAGIQCTKTCHGTHSYLDGNTCKTECPNPGNPFISAVQNFNTGTESGTCTNTCDGANFQLDDTSFQYASTNQKYYCSTACSTFSYNYFYMSGSIKKCTDKCGNQSSTSNVPDTYPYLDGAECKAECPSGGNKFISLVQNFNTGTEYGTCVAACDPADYEFANINIKYASTNQKHYCTNSCSTFGFSRFYTESSVKKCTDVCGNQGADSLIPNNFPYLDGMECKIECPSGGNKFISTVQNFNTGTEYGTCVGTCSGANFELSDTSFQYASTNQKYYCSTTCSTFNYDYFYTSGSVKKCTNVCGNQSNTSGVPSTFVFISQGECLVECPSSHKFISSGNNAGDSTDYGTCVDTCSNPNYQVTHPGKTYSPSGNQKHYCISACNIFGYTNYFIDPSDANIRICTDTCGNQSSQSGVPDTLPFLHLNQCLAQCPNDYKFITNGNNVGDNTDYGDCSQTCDAAKFQITDSSKTYNVTGNPQKHYCVDSCSYFGFTKQFILQSPTIKKCTDVCGNQSSTSGVPNTYAYLDGTECKEECPSSGNKFIDPVQNFNTGTEFGTCTNICDTSHFQLEDTSFKYSSNNQKYYCSTACSTFSYNYFYTSGSIKKCADTCGNQSSTSGVPDTHAYLDGTECKTECPSSGNKFIDPVQNFNLANEYGTCTNTCDASHFQLDDTSFQYASTNQKLYCSSACSTFGYSYFYVSGSIKKCADKCGNQSSTSKVPDTHAYLDGTECKEECPSGGNKFIDPVQNFNTGTEYGTCTNICTTSHFQLDDTSFQYTSTNQKYYCSTACSTFSYNYFYKVGSTKKCADTCGNQSSTSKVPDTHAYLDGTECKTECPSGGNKFISTIQNFNTGTEYGTCVGTCDGANFQLDDTSFQYASTNQKYYCSTACSTFSYNYFYMSGSIKKCADTCGNQSSTSKVPDTHAYLDGTECKTECPSGGNKFISGVQNFNTGTEYGTCVGTCTGANFQMESTTITYSPSSNQKYYCSTACSTFSVNYFYISGSVKKCTSICGNQSSTYGIPNSLAYLDGTECKEECPSGGNKFISGVQNFNTGTEYGTCGGTCNDPSFQLSSPDYTYISTTVKEYCLSACDKDSYTKYYVSGSINYCVDDCRHDHSTNTMIADRRYRLTQGAMELCSVTCPTTHLSQVRKWQEGDEDALCASSCSSSEFILESTSFPKIYCLTACNEGSFTKEFTNGGSTYCTNSCLPEVAGPEITVIPNIRYHYSDSGRTFCVSKCPVTHLYIDSPQEFNISLEHGECLSLCDDPKTRLNHPSLLYSDDSPKYYCNTGCTLGNFLFTYSSGGANYCTDSCTSPLNPDQRYEYIDDLGKRFCLNKCPVTVKDIENFNTDQESGTCESNCLELTFQSDLFKWADDSLKTFCVPECNSLVETHPYKTDDRTCVDSCQTVGYLFTMDDYSCSNSCSDFILNDFYCVKECPEEYPLSEEQHCVKTCSEANPLIQDFNTCVKECPLFSYEEFCVEKCDSEKLIEHLHIQNRPYTAFPFILSTKKCASGCSEINYPYINEITNECMSTCPPTCDESPCSGDSLKYKDAEFYCREECTNPIFPFIDEEAKECLTECKPERAFVLENNCLKKCPKTHSLIAKEPSCEDKSCNSSCNTFTLRCVNQCPSSLPFNLTLGDESECVCECPQFFVVEEKECVLFCDPELGFVPTDNELSCNHCFTDMGGMYFYEGECVDSCPTGTSFNQNSVCVPCKTLDLWKNETGVCIPFTRCDKLSYFDYENQTCTACNKKGYMITKKGTLLACDKTDCSEGFIYQAGSQPICVFCNEKEFFAEPDCKDSCPQDMIYSFGAKKRCFSCTSVCSCCTNGSCRGETCQCDSGWSGRYCNISQADVGEAAKTIIEFLNKRIRNGALNQNENSLILEIMALYAAQSRRRALKLEDSTVMTFMKNIYYLILRQYKEYSYQPKVFDTLDKLLALSAMYLSKTKDRTMLDKAMEFLLESTNKIQLFNVTMSIILDFERVPSGQFEGETFSLSFGTDVSKENQVNLRTCLSRMSENFNLSPAYEFPYRILKMKGVLSKEEPPEDAFVASTTPLIMLWIYLDKGPINVSKACEEKFIDLAYEVELPVQETETKAQKINLTGINVFNKQDPFFNDRCVPASDGKDLTISQRKSQFFLDSSQLCKETSNQICQIQGVDENNKAKCACRGIQNKKKSSLESTFSSYPKSNYILVTCLSTFKSAVLTQNIGFYTIAMPCLLAILLIFYVNPKIDKDLISENRFKYMRTDIEIFDPDRMEAEVYFKQCFNLKWQIGPQMAEQTYFDFDSLPTLPDLDQLSISEQLLLDNRSNWQFAKDTLISNNTLCYTLFSKSLIDPKPFLILLYVSELNMSSMLNSFFIDDDLVENFNESGDHSLLASFTSELPKTIWAMLTAKIMMGILNAFYSFKTRSIKTFLRRLMLTKDESAVKAYNLFLNDHTWRLIGLSLLVIPFNLFCLYFVVIYSEIYSNSTGIWFNGIIMGLIIDNVIVEGIPSISLILTRALAKRFPSLEFVFKLVLKIKSLSSLQALG